MQSLLTTVIVHLQSSGTTIVTLALILRGVSSIEPQNGRKKIHLSSTLLPMESCKTSLAVGLGFLGGRGLMIHPRS